MDLGLALGEGIFVGCANLVAEGIETVPASDGERAPLVRGEQVVELPRNAAAAVDVLCRELKDDALADVGDGECQFSSRDGWMRRHSHGW